MSLPVQLVFPGKTINILAVINSSLFNKWQDEEL
jgi:hypothetical protein